MFTTLMPNPKQQFFDNNGLPLVGGKIYTYDAGTTNPKDTYVDDGGVTPQPNPVPLNARGEPVNAVRWSGNYYIEVFDALGNLIYTVDDFCTPVSYAELAATPGAGIIGFLYALAYPIGSLGRWITDLALGAGSTFIGFIQAGVGAVLRTVQSRLLEEVHATDFMTQAQRDDVAAGTALLDVGDAIQAAIDSRPGRGIMVRLPFGICLVTKTIYLRRNKVRLRGHGPGVSMIKFVNVLGGVVFSGDTAKTASLNTYSSCALEDFEVVSSGSASTDASIIVDLTSFSYGHFSIEAQTRRLGAAIYYGQGNNGFGPYFNHIESTGLFGGTDYSQDAFRFRGGAFALGSNGPNSNFIGPITRAASLNTIADIRVGLQNMFSGIGGESIGGTYFLLGGNAAVSTGTSSGSNGQISMVDTSKTWVVNAYLGGAVQITGGTGSGQIRTIKTNTATQLSLSEPWATIPDATSMYSIFEGKVNGNKFISIRGEGLASLNPDFIYANPGVDLTEFSNVDISSLGSGQYLWDYTGSARNSFYGGAKVTFTHTFVTPGASANINAYPRVSLFGGIKPAGVYVVEWVKVAPQYSTNGDAMTVTLDVGGATVGAGAPSLAIGIPNGNDIGMALTRYDQKLTHEGTNESVFLNLQTGAAFSAAYSVNVTWCITLL